MAGNIKGITIEIGGNTAPLDKALKKVNAEAKSLEKELKGVNTLLKLDPTNTELLAQKQTLLTKSVDQTKEKLEALRVAKIKADNEMKSGTQINQEQYRNLQREIVYTEQNLKKLESQAKQSNTAIEKIGTAAKNIGAKATDMGQKASVASAVIVAGVGAAAKEAMDAADELVKLSDETGLTTDRLQELSYIGGQVGVDINTIASAQAKLTKSMSGARDGTGAQAEAFKALGISVTDSNGQLRNASDVMGEAFNALSGISNETERDALSMAIFGKSAMDLNPMVKLGADGMADMAQKAHEIGAVMDEDTIKSLDDFGDSMAGLKSSIMGAVGESLTPFIQKLTDLVNWFSSLDNGTKGMILTILGVVAVIGPLLIIVGMVASGIAALAGVIAFLASPVGIAIACIAGFIAIFVAVQVAFGVLTQAFSTTGEKLAGPFKTAADFIKAQIEKIKGFFKFKFAWPKLPLPHFSVAPPGWKIGDLLKGSLPSLGISWYDQGGVFNNPAVIGVGEKRPEFVGALDDLRKIVREEAGGGGTINHTGTITVKGVNNAGELVAVVEQNITNNIITGNRRIPNKVSLIPIT